MVDGKALDRFMQQCRNTLLWPGRGLRRITAEDQQPDVLKYVREGRKIIVLRTFSKTYGLAACALPMPWRRKRAFN